MSHKSVSSVVLLLDSSAFEHWPTVTSEVSPIAQKTQLMILSTNWFSRSCTQLFSGAQGCFKGVLRNSPYTSLPYPMPGYQSSDPLY